MKLKKLTALLLCALLSVSTVSFAACEESPNSSNENESSDSEDLDSSTPSTPDLDPDAEDPTGSGLTLSHEGGAYSAPFSLTVTPKNKNDRMYYTLDCTEPTVQSNRLNTELTISDNSSVRDYKLTRAVTQGSPYTYGVYSYETGNECTVLKLLETDEDGNEVARKTVSYFIRSGGKDYFTLPVVSISMPHENAVNFYNDIENEPKERANVEYFDFKNDERFALNSQIKVGGNWTKGFAYRTINLNFNKDENGKKNTPVKVALFGDRRARNGEKLTNFKRFRLHSGGNSQLITWFGDAFTQKVAAEVPYNGSYLKVATTGYRPAEVYLNGEYWGLYAIREHYSDVYFEQNYGVDKDDVVLIDRTTTANNTYRFEVAEDCEEKTGNALAEELFDFLYDNNFYSSSSFQQLCEKVDIDSLIDLVLVHAYAGNWDFMNNNIKMWRTAHIDPSNPYADGKWRFCLHDLDFSFEQQWGDNGIYHANGYLLEDNDDWVSHRHSYLTPYYTSSLNNIQYRPGRNYLDFYLGNANLEYNNVGYLPKTLTCLLSSPMQNSEFQAKILARATAVKTIYASDKATEILTGMRNEITAPMQRHLRRWSHTDADGRSNAFTYTKWYNNATNTATVLYDRPRMKDYLNYFNGGYMYQNADYFERQVEAAIYRFNRGY